MRPPMKIGVGYQGFYRLDIYLVGKNHHEVVTASDSVCALFYLKDQDKVLLVRQPRVAMATDDNPHGFITELVAGRFDVDLGPKALVVKEAAEEVGAKITEDQVMLLNNGEPVAVSSGMTNEKSHLAYVEITSDMIEMEEREFGLAEEGEKIQRVWLEVQDFLDHCCEDLRVFALQQWFIRRYLFGAALSQEIKGESK